MYRDIPKFVTKSNRRSKIAATHVRTLRFLRNSSVWRIVFQRSRAGRRKVKALYERVGSGWIEVGNEASFLTKFKEL
jgi:hypothetical protein